MNKLKINELADRLKQQRIGKGVREVARDVGISAATLSRVENGKIPDLETFGKICSYLGDDPSIYLGLPSSYSSQPKAQVHFKKEAAIEQKSALALSEMIMLAQQALLNEDQL